MSFAALEGVLRLDAESMEQRLWLLHERGYVEPVMRHDGQIGWLLTDKGRAEVEAQR